MVLCEFYIMYPNHTYLSPTFISTLHHCILTKNRKKNYCENYSVSQCVPQFTLLSTLLCLQWLTRPLASPTLSMLDPHWDFSWIFCWCPVHGDPTALDLQGQPLYTLQQFRDGVDVELGWLKALDLGLRSIWVSQPTSSPHPYHQDKLSSTALDGPPKASAACLLSDPISHTLTWSQSSGQKSDPVK